MRALIIIFLLNLILIVVRNEPSSLRGSSTSQSRIVQNKPAANHTITNPVRAAITQGSQNKPVTNSPVKVIVTNQSANTNIPSPVKTTISQKSVQTITPKITGAQVSVPASNYTVVRTTTTSAQKKLYGSSKYPMRNEAHRGAGYLEPENSIPAFQRAITLDIDGTETDVWLTKDKKIAVTHGKPGGLVEFAHNVTLNISEIYAADLLNHILPNGQTIPLLDDVLDIIKDKVYIDIDIKETRDEVIDILLDLLTAKNMLYQVKFSSFHHYLRTTLTHSLQKRGITIPISFGFLVSDLRFPGAALTQAGDSLNLDMTLLKKNKQACLNEIARARARGMKVEVWFPIDYGDEDGVFGDFIDLKLDTIITDTPVPLATFLSGQSTR